jgi:hypothetical protein
MMKDDGVPCSRFGANDLSTGCATGQRVETGQNTLGTWALPRRRRRSAIRFPVFADRNHQGADLFAHLTA